MVYASFPALLYPMCGRFTVTVVTIVQTASCIDSVVVTFLVGARVSASWKPLGVYPTESWACWPRFIVFVVSPTCWVMNAYPEDVKDEPRLEMTLDRFEPPRAFADDP